MSTPSPSPADDRDPKLPRRGRRREGFTLDRFLKYEGMAETGGTAKLMIQDGLVTVNGEVETRRRRQLSPGDVVCLDDEERVVPGPKAAEDDAGDHG